MSDKYYYDELNVYRKGRGRRFFLILTLLVLITTGVYHITKPLPEGMSFEGTPFAIPGSSITFLKDVTYETQDGERESKQEIFDEVFRMINKAREFILIDMFLYNDFQGKGKELHRLLSSELTKALIDKKKTEPKITIVVITDPFNLLYGGHISQQLSELKQNDIQVIVTNLLPLRDSNPAYSSLWRTFFVWFGNNPEKGILPNPFIYQGDKVTFRTYFSLLNFKANHRKLIVTDVPVSLGKRFATLITSGNPHDASSAHSNIAVKIEDALWQDVIVSEQATALMSKDTLPQISTKGILDRNGDTKVVLLTEKKIKSNIIKLIENTKRDDTIDMVMFYLSERDIINALIEASHRGALIRLILDPNKDAFGIEKNGVPNRPVAKELRKRSGGNIDIRWCNTRGEQCHSKLILFNNDDGFQMMLGSANLTRRNLDDYNLETNVLISAQTQIKAIQDAYSYVNMVWDNEGGKIFSVDYEVFEDDTLYKTAQYHIMESTGLSSF